MIRDFVPFNYSVMEEKDARALNPLVLAFVGDAVQQLMVRTRLAETSTAKAGALHSLAAEEIKAPTQAKRIEKILDRLEESEKDIYRRARNSKMNTMAKHASATEYKKASGFEAVIGYLYLIGAHDRLKEIFALCESEEK